MLIRIEITGFLIEFQIKREKEREEKNEHHFSYQ